jgi:hypothetical protein
LAVISNARARAIMEEHMKYGPNTPAVERLLKQLDGITPEQAEDLERTPWYFSQRMVLDAAWNAARSSGRYAAWRAALHEGHVPTGMAAWNEIRDAILALVVRDLISGEHFEALYGPWKRVMDK